MKNAQETIHFRTTEAGRKVFEEEFKLDNAQAKLLTICAQAAVKGWYWTECSDLDLLKSAREADLKVVFLDGVSHVSWRLPAGGNSIDLCMIADRFWASFLDPVLAELDAGETNINVSFEAAWMRDHARVFFETNDVNVTKTGSLNLLLK
jgi:hypothetical protein